MDLRIYVTSAGRKPFEEWLAALSDKGGQGRAIAQAVEYLSDWKQRGQP